MKPKKTILIIEDQAAFRTIYQDVLEYSGYLALTAADGEEGWHTALDKKPDLILLDLGLPKLNGFEVLERVRNHPVTREIPVFVISVVGETQFVQRAMELGADDYYIKGMTKPKQVLEKVHTLLAAVEPGKNTTVLT